MSAVHPNPPNHDGLLNAAPPSGTSRQIAFTSIGNPLHQSSYSSSYMIKMVKAICRDVPDGGAAFNYPSYWWIWMFSMTANSQEKTVKQ